MDNSAEAVCVLKERSIRMYVSAMQAAVKPRRVTVANHLRRLVVLAAILFLAALGLWVEKGMAKLSDRILAAFVTFGPAAIYLFGYFYWLPDTLGAAVKIGGSLLYRWSSFARISAVIASVVWTAWLCALVFSSNVLSSSTDTAPKLSDLAFGLALVVLPPVLMFGCVAASEQYLSKTQFTENSEKLQDPQDEWFPFIGSIARFIARWFTKPRALSSGGLLVLAALLLNMTLMGECGGDARKGYEIVTGKAALGYRGADGNSSQNFRVGSR